jgi:hypothetical protein
VIEAYEEYGEPEGGFLSLDEALEMAMDPPHEVPVHRLHPGERALYFQIARNVARWRVEEGIYE